jgi:hypothetical protein
MQGPNQPWYRWFWKKGDHWYVVFWTLFSVFGGPLSAHLLTARDERRGKPTRRYWQALGVTLAAQVLFLVVCVVIVGLVVWAAPTPQMPGTMPPLSDLTQPAEGFAASGEPETTQAASGAVDPASPPTDLATLLQYGNAAVEVADIFFPIVTANVPSWGPVTDPNEAALLTQLDEANQTKQQTGNPEAFWAVIDPSSGFYREYQTSGKGYVGFDNDKPFGTPPTTTPGQPRTYQITITQAVNPDGTLAGPGGNGIAKTGWPPFAPEGPEGQWLLTKLVPARPANPPPH